MQEGIDERSALSGESLGTEIGLQYVQALTPKIGKEGDIQGTDLAKNLTPGGEGDFSWFGDKRVHASHRSNLLRKDSEFYGKYNWKESSDLPYFWPVK